MDDANIPQDRQAVVAHNGAEREAESDGRLQTITEACSVMKDEIANEAHIIAGTEKMGKQPTITEACSVMKDRMADEAQYIVGVPHSSDLHPTDGVDGSNSNNMGTTAQSILADPETIPTNSSTAYSSDSEHPQRKELEQAKKALKEANWFEQ